MIGSVYAFKTNKHRGVNANAYGLYDENNNAFIILKGSVFVNKEDEEIAALIEREKTEPNTGIYTNILDYRKKLKNIV